MFIQNSQSSPSVGLQINIILSIRKQNKLIMNFLNYFSNVLPLIFSPGEARSTHDPNSPSRHYPLRPEAEALTMLFPTVDIIILI